MRFAVLLAVPIVFFIGLIGIVFALHKPNDSLPGCLVDDCPLEIHAIDSGATFTYRETVRFGVVLDETKNPKEDLQCSPAGILGPISNVPPETPPLYAARFEGIATGSCTLSSGDFSVKIVIMPGR